MAVNVLIGDVREVLASLPADHFDCVVTSPPYWGLRDYGVAGQLGMEPTLGEHIDALVSVFAEVWRVMKPEASLWLNYGDCYATSPNGRSAADTKAAGTDDRTFRDKPFSTVGGALKPRDLCMVANRLAIALQEAGWWVRSEIIWGKTNPMPDSSGRYRPSTSHEKIFLLTKNDEPVIWQAKDTHEWSKAPDLSEKLPAPRANEPDRTIPRWLGYATFYDSKAARIERSQHEDSNGYPGSSDGFVRQRSTIGNRLWKTPDGWDATVGIGGHGSVHRGGREKGKTEKQRGHSRRHNGFNDRWDAMSKEEQQAGGRLLRNYEAASLEVWEMATSPFSDAHFATFPPELVSRALTAACPKGGHVLDPFGGAGTVGLVASRMMIDATLIELNPAYAEMARERVENDGSWLKSAIAKAKRRPAQHHGDLFPVGSEESA